jgi:Rad9
LSNLFNNFPSNLRDIALNITRNKFEISNHINHPEKDVQTIRLKYQLDPDEFITYDVENDNRLIIFSKDFLPIIEIAEVSESDIQIAFTRNSDPVFVNIMLDASVSLQVMLSSMQEDILKTRTNPPAQTSYKEIMDSYIQQHQKGKETAAANQVNAISDTEMKRIVDPTVSSFGNSGHFSSPKVTSTEPRQKRKSFDMNESDVSVDRTLPNSSSADMAPKKIKTNQHLSQKEQQEVSQLVMELENLDYNEDEDFQCLAQPQPKTSSKPFIPASRILEGLKPMSRRKTLTAPSVTESSCSSAESEISMSVRLEVSLAKFQSEKQDSDKTDEDVQGKAHAKKPEMRKKLYYTKKLFKGFLNADQNEEPAMLSQGANSDSEDF